ncbi:Guanine nucleotide-binding protein subunit beta [Intoshia linei]|uniref:Guanine nucleotide-binding protein subunit beta n=1 Tax=Intoshia linei TaxID=1819745 RepID=A0A177AV85_9BILA|nr:Guanine nucleotide-binding protein subunit beta [Intoshia linei]
MIIVYGMGSNLTRSNENENNTDEKQDDYPYIVQEHLLPDEPIDAETTGRPKRFIQLPTKYKDFVMGEDDETQSADLRVLREEAENLKGRIFNAKQEVCDCTMKEKAEHLNCVEIKMICVKVHRGHNAKIFSAGMLKSKAFLSAAQDGKMLIWDLATGCKRNSVNLDSQWVMTCTYAPSGNFIASGGLDNVCTVYNVNNKEGNIRKWRELSVHTGYLSCCRFLDDSQILTSSGDMTCSLWDLETGQQTTQFLGHNGDIMSVELSPDHRTFVSGACDATAKLWDIRDGQCKQTFIGHEADINTVSMNPHGYWFATGSDDATCLLHDIRADQHIATYSHDNVISGVTSSVFSLSGRILFTGHDDLHGHVWDTLKQEHSGILASHDNRITELIISDDGTTLISASWDHTLKSWK